MTGVGRTVMKFGGTSVASPERVKHVAGRVAAARRAGHDVVAVVSAPGDTTDDLLALARAVHPRPPRRELDVLLSTGEQISIALLAMALDALGVPAVSLTGAQGGILTDATHARARILAVDPRRIRAALDAGQVAVVAGFQGVDPQQDITTLGRGGSDLTAVALAAALKADHCEIYTDVDGIFTADPRIVPEARRLDAIGYEEMMELASLGAQVMQLRAVEYGREHGVRIHVRSTFKEGPGTVIREDETMERKRVVTGVACDKNTAKVTILGVPDRPGVAHQLFAALAADDINVDMIIQSSPRRVTADMSFTVPADDLDRALEIARRVAQELGAEGAVGDADVAKVSIVGAGMISTPGVAAEMFGILAREGINIEMIGSTEIKVSCVVRKARADDATRALHKGFRLDEPDYPFAPEAGKGSEMGGQGYPEGKARR